MNNKDLIAKMSTERIEQNIANIYYLAHQERIDTPEWTSGLLGLYWKEFDKRVAAGQVKDIK